MINEFHKKAIARITPEKRAFMVKSLEVISQIHSILDRKDITQKALAGLLRVSPAAICKMLNPGSNLELYSIAKLEVILGETIITTPQMVEVENDNGRYIGLPHNRQESEFCLTALYLSGEEIYRKIAV